MQHFRGPCAVVCFRRLVCGPKLNLGLQTVDDMLSHAMSAKLSGPSATKARLWWCIGENRVGTAGPSRAMQRVLHPFPVARTSRSSASGEALASQPVGGVRNISVQVDLAGSGGRSSIKSARSTEKRPLSATNNCGSPAATGSDSGFRWRPFRGSVMSIVTGEASWSRMPNRRAMMWLKKGKNPTHSQHQPCLPNQPSVAFAENTTFGRPGTAEKHMMTETKLLVPAKSRIFPQIHDLRRRKIRDTAKKKHFRIHTVKLPKLRKIPPKN